MATSFIDPAFMLQTAADGTAATYLETITALITALNGQVGTDASNVVNAIIAPGAIDPAIRHHTILVDGTDAFTLANGTFIGQKVSVFCLAGTSIPVGTITPASPIGYATVTALGGLGDTVLFEWNGTGWLVIASFGVTFT